MCSIAGKVTSSNPKILEAELELMNKKLSHRGPDDTGVSISPDGKVGLANNRLAVIDLSSAGHMPMSYMDKYEITYNGEFYNFKEARTKLRRLGYKFSSNSDTEVILALYDKYGPICLDYIRGMFSFAIFDKVKNIIFLARDRLGKKPLKYYHKNGVFIFASELKAILSQKEVKKQIDNTAVYNYLTFGYVPSPSTGFVDIFKLDPGSYLIYEIDKDKLTKQRYWKPDFSKKQQLSETEWTTKILDILEESVKLRMVSDVDLGVFLSGGVDSSAIVALMAKNSKNRVKTFTIGFKEMRYDESKYARIIANRFNTLHEEILVDANKIDLLPELAYMYEEPFANSSSIITYLVSKKAKEYVTVALNGDGGDENFAGYDRYNRINRDVVVNHFSKHLSDFGIPLSKALSHTHLATKFWGKTERYLLKCMLPLSQRFASYIEYFSETEKQQWAKGSLLTQLSSYTIIENAFLESGIIDPRDEVLYWDLTKYLPDELLVKVDIASMAVGLEARSPLTDHKLTELACQIPFSLKVKNGVNKYIYKKALEKLLPKEIIYRKKMGFSIPLQDWFMGDLSTFAKSVILSKGSYVRNIFMQDKIKEMFDKHSSTNDFGPRLWNLLSLELWHRSYF